MPSAALPMILEALPDGALLIEPGGQIVQMNAAAARLLGCTEGALVGQGIDQLLADSEGARHAMQRATVFASVGGPGAPVAAQFALRRCDGQEFPGELNLSPLRGDHGPLAIAVIRDLRERRELEQALREATRLKSEFFGHMSHELRTPLNGIIGFAEFLLEGKPGRLNPEQHEYLGDILASGRRLLSMINGVVELSRLESGTAEISSENFSLIAAIEEACSVVAAAAQQKGIGLRRSIASGLLHVSLDRRRLLQVLNYLLANAIKFSSEGGEIRIEAEPHGASALRLRIFETGVVKRSAEFEQLLSDYPQFDSSAIRRFGGTGLDLVLARKIVEAQSGLFSVKNEAGHGAAFSLILPCAFESAASSLPESLDAVRS